MLTLLTTTDAPSRASMNPPSATEVHPDTEEDAMRSTAPSVRSHGSEAGSTQDTSMPESVTFWHPLPSLQTTFEPAWMASEPPCPFRSM
eukprot:2929616-Rhodomonas_salina.1